MTGTEDFRRRLRDRLKRNRQAFEGEYKEELAALSGLSRQEIDLMTPGDTTDVETYEALIEIVKEASASNVQQADLVEQIKELGDVGIAIAKKVPGLAALLT